MPLADRIVTRKLDRLGPDPRNPRLPARLAEASDTELVTYLARHYDILPLAESIANFGYFPSEPLVVIPKEPGRDPQDEADIPLIVVEGNRRLTALKGLLEEDVRRTLRPPARWDALAGLAERIHLSDDIPVITGLDWSEAAPLIGFRHISGIQGWDPYPKARFIARLADDEDRDFDEIAPLVGEEIGAVRALYRNYRIVEQARDIFGIPTSEAEALFGTFTAALNRRALREFIGAPQPGDVIRGQSPLPQDAGDRFGELLSWIYGGDDEEPVIDESRDLKTLAKVVAVPAALDELKTSRDLELADEIAGGPGRRLSAYLRRAGNALEAAEENIEDADDDTRPQVERCAVAVARLREALDGAVRR
jgi:hypothetical protein